MMRIGSMTSLVILVSATMVSAASVSYFDDKKSQVHEAIGEILSETPREVVIKTSKEELTIPVNRIEAVKYDRQPKDMINIRNFERQGRYDEAVAALLKVVSDIDAKDQFLASSIEFDIFQDMAKLGLIDPSKGPAAIKRYEEHAKSLSTSRHHYPSLELLGRLQLQAGDYEKATDTLGKLGSLDWPGYKEKSQVYLATTELRRGRAADADRIFDGVIASKAEGKVADEQRRHARLGKADALIALKKPAESETLCREVIASIADDDELAFAEARNHLGDALREQGKAKEAVLDGYLWVHTLYPTQSAEHAKAVFHLAKLFKEIGYPGYAEQMTELMKTTFGQTEWAQKLGSAGS